MDALEFLRERMPIERLAASYNGISFSPRQRAQSDFDSAAEWLSAALAELPADRHEAVAAGFVKHWSALVSARGRTMSPMITGPARFPVDRNRKRMDSEHKRLGEYLDFQKRIRGEIAKAKQGPSGVIYSDDPDAIAQLKAKLEKNAKDWADAKRWNAQYRKGGVAAMDVGEKLKASIAALMEKEKWIRVPFNLSGYGPEAKRIKDRIAQLEAKAGVPDADIPLNDGIMLLVRPDENRVRLIFDGKPAAEVRERLKRAGFKWAPSEGAWQRFYSENAIRAAKEAVKAA